MLDILYYAVLFLLAVGFSYMARNAIRKRSRRNNLRPDTIVHNGVVYRRDPVKYEKGVAPVQRQSEENLSPEEAKEVDFFKDYESWKW